MNWVTVDSMICIEQPDADLLDYVVKQNTFKNPALAEAERQGRQTRHIPKYICVYQEMPSGALLIPRGFLGELIRYRPALAKFADGRSINETKIPRLGDVQLRPYQVEAVETAIRYDQGIIQAPSGSGKTIMGLSLIERKQQKALILTHSKALAKQWKLVIEDLMGITPGMVGGGRWTEGKQITICMLQTLSKNKQRVHELACKHGLVLVDEAHHVPAASFAEVMGWMPCKYRYGLTATPHRRDGLHKLIHRVMGRTLTKVSLSAVQRNGGVVKSLIEVVSTGCQPKPIKDWGDYLQKIISDQSRNHLLTELTQGAVDTAPTLVLTDRIEHAETLAKLAREKGMEPVLAHGQMAATARKEAMDAMTTAQLTIGTTGLLGEGLDVSGWGVLIMATPISGRVRLLQAIGRVIRPHPGKEHGIVIDLVDSHPLAKSSHKKRLSIYRERGYPINNQPKVA